MAIWTLSRDDTSEIIHFDEDLRWVDEFEWSRLAQSEPVYTRGGAMVVQQSTKLAGRPITLSGEWVWIDRAIFKQLRGWSEEPQLSMTLTRGNAEIAETYRVMFRNHELGIACEPVVFMTPEQSNSKYTGEVRLMEI